MDNLSKALNNFKMMGVSTHDMGKGYHLAIHEDKAFLLGNIDSDENGNLLVPKDIIDAALPLSDGKDFKIVPVPR